MDSQPRFLITPRLVLGLGLALFGLTLTLDRLHLVDADRVLRYWPVGLMLIGGLMIVQGNGHQRIRGIIFTSIGAWIFLNMEGVLPVSIWELFWPVILIIVGISLLFRPARRRPRRDREPVDWNPPGQSSFGGGAAPPPYASDPGPGVDPGDVRDNWKRYTSANVDGAPHISIFSVMSGVRRTSNATDFRGADITAFWGGARLDLRLASIPPGEEAVIDVTAIMGGAEIVVPSSWAVSTPILPLMGSLEDKRLPPIPVDGKIPLPDQHTPRLVIRGFVMMGSVVLTS